MNFLRTVALLCSGFKTYRPFRDLPVTTSLKYLIKLVLVLGLMLMLSYVPWALIEGHKFAAWADANLPTFDIKDGRVVTQALQPFAVRRNDTMFILDTTGTITAPDTNAPTGLLIAADKAVVWKSVADTTPPAIVAREVPLRGFPEGRVDGRYWRQLIHTTVALGTPVMWLMVSSLGLLSCLIQAYLFALIASFMERSVPHPMTLAQLLNISIHAVTPAAIIVTAYMAMRLEGLSFWLIYLIAYGVFLIGATNACRDGVRDEPRDEDLL